MAVVKISDETYDAAVVLILLGHKYEELRLLEESSLNNVQLEYPH